MSKLLDFLENRVKNAETEIQVPFSIETDELATITKVTAIEYAHYQKRAIIISGDNTSFDTGKYQMDLIINHTTSPDFKSEELMKKLNVATSEDLVNVLLTAGEVQNLATEISEFSGLGKSFKDIKKEAKNS